jgi:hypothetical protein
MKTPAHTVTDHALLQYLEHVHGIEVEVLRRTLAWLADASHGVSDGMGTVEIRGVRFATSGGTVCGIVAGCDPE